MGNINLSSWLKEKIQSGECILFLGAGASLGATKKKWTKSAYRERIKRFIIRYLLRRKKKGLAIK